MINSVVFLRRGAMFLLMVACPLLQGMNIVGVVEQALDEEKANDELSKTYTLEKIKAEKAAIFNGARTNESKAAMKSLVRKLEDPNVPDLIKSFTASEFMSLIDNIEAAVISQKQQSTVNAFVGYASPDARAAFNKMRWMLGVHALVPGIAIAYAYFHWQKWADIKTRHVWMPLFAGMGLCYIYNPATYPATRARFFGNAFYYGSSLGLLYGDFMAQRRVHGGVGPWVKKTYAAVSLNNKMLITACIGAVSGFIVGLTDTGFYRALNGFELLLPFFPRNDKNAKDKKSLLLGTAGYAIQTVIPLISKRYTPIITCANYAGKGARFVVQSTGFGGKLAV